MSCESANRLVEPYLDGELDAALKAQIEEHLAGCPSCAETHAQLAELREAIRERAPYYTAPPGLADRIRDSLPQVRRTTRPVWRVWAMAASILLVASLGWNLAQMRTRGADEVIDSHIRSLMGTHLVDVPSSDQHTVKPWFNGKLDFSPEVRDFAPEGFPLAGGRIDYLAGRTVAALVYRRRQHVINVFVWPGAASSSVDTTRNGYHVLGWAANGMTWRAVSDLNSAELHQFVDLYRR
jgi:anti-sigma factor (TIGR02949 family)